MTEKPEKSLYDLEAEQAVLGAMLLDRNAPLIASQLLDAKSFIRDRHQILFRTMVALTERGVAIDHLTMRDELLRNDQLTKVGGLDYLAELVDTVPTAANVEFHATIVRDFALRRELLAQSQTAATLAGDTSQPIAQSLSRVVDELVKSAHPAARSPQKTLKAELWEVLAEVERQAKLGEFITGIPSGIPRLDDLTDGWEKGRLIVMAARPKKGKTGWALHCAAEACRGEGSVYFATAEQPRRELIRRLVAMESAVSLRTVRTPEMLDMVSKKLMATAGDLSQWSIAIDEVSRTPAQVRLGLQRHIAEHGPVDLVLVDYLGKYHSGGKHERHDLEIGAITGPFGEMAMALNVPVILLAQLNRESVKGGVERRPTPSDLRDSGAIEQDASQLLFLYRDEKSDKAEQNPNWLQVILELNRHGPTGTVDVVFEKSTGRWNQALRMAS